MDISTQTFLDFSQQSCDQFSLCLKKLYYIYSSIAYFGMRNWVKSDFAGKIKEMQFFPSVVLLVIETS